MSSSVAQRALTVAVEGCLHGELDNVYATIAEAENKGGSKVDLLIGKDNNHSLLLLLEITDNPKLLPVCGDFQGIRNKTDLQALAVPQKYRRLVLIIK